jgi:hypothetical protein
MNVNESRKYLFTRKGRSLKNLPPTLEVLKQHTKQAVLLLKYSSLSSAGTSRSSRLGLEEMPYWLGTIVDDTFRSITGMLRVDTLWMQERLHTTKQVC